MKRQLLIGLAIAAVAGCDSAELLGPEGGAAFARIPAGWSSAASMPYGVQAPVAASNGRFIYVFGGATAPTTWTTLTQVYDVAKDAWSLGAPFTTPRNFAMAASMQDGVHLLGGANPGILADHHVYDVRSQTWSGRAPMPVAVDAAIAVTIGNKLYVIGGGLGGPNYTGAVQIYDTGTDSWSLGTPMPTPRLSAAAAVIDGLVYVAGGQTTGIITVPTLERYDPATDTWMTLSPMPVPREALGGGLVARQFCVFGGRLANANPTGDAFPETYCYDPRRDTWTQGPDMLTPRVEMATAEARGKLFAFGGRNQTVFANTTLEVLAR